MICPNCGKEIEDNGKFCGYCGYKLVQDATPVTHKKESAKNTDVKSLLKNKKVLFGIVAVIAVVAVLALLMFGGLGSNDKNDNTGTSDYDSEETASIDKSALLKSSKDSDYTLYYKLSDYAEFYESNEYHEDDAEEYDDLCDQISDIDDEVSYLLPTDCARKKINDNITYYINKKGYIKVSSYILVTTPEKNQKYVRKYYFNDGSLFYAYVYDPKNEDDNYKLYYDDGVLYCYKTPKKTYKYSDMIRSKWGYFAYQEAKDLYHDCIYGVSKEDDYDEYEDEDYILPTSDSEYLTRSDVEDLSQEENRLAINEIYARHGYTYTTEDLQEYFEDKSWYHSDPDVNQSTWNDSMLNNYERENINLLATVSKEKGYR